LLLYDVERHAEEDVTIFLIFDGDVGSDFSFTFSIGRNGAVNFSGDSSFLESISDFTVRNKLVSNAVKPKIPTGIFVLLY
jgi:hypothetical protein